MIQFKQISIRPINLLVNFPVTLNFTLPYQVHGKFTIKHCLPSLYRVNHPNWFIQVLEKQVI